MPRLIVLFGGSGRVGSAAAAALAKCLSAPHAPPLPPIRVFTRRPKELDLGAHVEAFEGDLDDARSVERSLEGAERVFLLSSAHPEMERREVSVIRAARRAGALSLLKLSGSDLLVGPRSPSLTMRQHFDIEEALKASGLRWAILRPSAYLQTLMEEILPFVRDRRSFSLPSARGRFAFVDTRDVGEAAAAILCGERHWNETHRLTGPEALSYAEVAQIVGEGLGEAVSYRRQSLFFARLAINQRVAYHHAREEAADLAALLANSSSEEPTDTIARLLGRPPRSLRDWVVEHRSFFSR